MITLILLLTSILVQDTGKSPAINVKQKTISYGEYLTVEINNKTGEKVLYYIDLETWNGRHWIEADPDIFNENYDKIFFTKSLAANKVLTIKYKSSLMSDAYLDRHNLYRFSLKYSKAGKIFKSSYSKTFIMNK